MPDGVSHGSSAWALTLKPNDFIMSVMNVPRAPLGTHLTVSKHINRCTHERKL